MIHAAQLDLPAPPPRKRLISLTPLIDVVFILLVFFMLATSSIEWRVIGLNAGEPAAASTAAVGEQAGPITLTLLPDRQIRFDGLLHTQAEVVDALATSPGGLSRAIVLAPAPNVSLQAAVEMLDALTDAGARRVTFGRVSPQGAAP